MSTLSPSIRSRSLGFVAASGLAVAALFLGATQAQAAGVVSDGSYEVFEVVIDDATGGLKLQSHNHADNSQFDPTGTVWKIATADATHGGFTSKEAGGPLSLGLTAEGEVYDEIGAPKQVHLDVAPAASNPGSLKVWEDTAGYDKPIIDSAAGDNGEDLQLQPNLEEAYHQHYNFTFSKAGTYTFSVTATDKSGEVTASPVKTYVFQIG